MITSRLIARQLYRQANRRMFSEASPAVATADTAKFITPPPEGAEKPINIKLEGIANSIAVLNLLEVSELSALLKKKLNLPETAFVPQMAAGSAKPADDEEEAAPKVVQTAFKVKLLKFEDTQKVPLIKKIKDIMEGMNLVQAKKFVESAPAVVKEDIPKDEAEKLKEELTKAGGIVLIE